MTTKAKHYGTCGAHDNEYYDNLRSGFFVYDFPLNYNDEYLDPVGECIAIYARDKVCIYDYDRNTHMIYTIEQ